MADMKITMLGTGSPRPEVSRSGPAQIIEWNNNRILFDCGEGTTGQLLKAGYTPESVTHLWFTHLHSDHTFGYGQFLIGGWGRGRSELTVIGPPGTKAFHEKILDLYKEDIDYRCSLGRSEKGVKDVHVIEVEEPGKVENPLGVQASAAKMIHNVCTYGYRLEIDGQVLVISGDTAPHEGIVELAEDADLLVIDASLAAGEQSGALAKIWDHLQKEHCTAEQAAEIAEQAKVKKVIFTHFLPEVDTEKAYQEAKPLFSGELIIPEDLETYYVAKTTAELGG
ncbi:ribonuclease Z [Alteribacillus persepolensis]|uniref:Ribonuclease Z n=1 Tax=Alteribacillus persepolensis TaxID=568899 RepID=A0A1G8A9J3_9BACI|nr:MBL fold metallo-hydrolase [Alteribacillus persepolensis]SDH17547.1 ribonuclease Z [Alteribacillus persepolensis]